MLRHQLCNGSGLSGKQTGGAKGIFDKEPTDLGDGPDQTTANVTIGAVAALSSASLNPKGALIRWLPVVYDDSQSGRLRRK